MNQLIIHPYEEEDIEVLRQKLKNYGFKLNDKFDKYVVPVQGTYITRTLENNQIIYQQNLYN